jgi:hypothetical protein
MLNFRRFLKILVSFFNNFWFWEPFVLYCTLKFGLFHALNVNSNFEFNSKYDLNKFSGSNIEIGSSLA